MLHQSKAMDSKTSKIPDPSPKPGDEMPEAEIDETLAGSFPASDPPSWTLGTNHHDETQPSEDDDA